MRIRRFVGEDVRQTMEKVRSALGSDALILATKRTEDGVEIISAVGYDEAELKKISEDTASQRRVSAATLLEPAAATAGPISTAATSIKRVEDSLPTVDNVAVNTASTTALANMREEIQSLRDLLQHQLADLAWSEKKRKNPVQVRVIDNLKAIGMNSGLAEDIAYSINADQHYNQAWQDTVNRLEQSIETSSRDLLEIGGIYALVGTTGVGKTTTVAKLATQYVMEHGSEDIGLITTDSYRIGAYEQLATYAKILKVPFKQVENADQLKQALNYFRAKKLVLIDTAGLSQHDKRLFEQQHLLSAGGRKIRTLLVLPATSQAAVLRDQINIFRETSLTACIVTKIDECLHLGDILSTLITSKVPVMYYTDGQQIPEDLHICRRQELIAMATKTINTQETGVMQVA